MYGSKPPSALTVAVFPGMHEASWHTTPATPQQGLHQLAASSSSVGPQTGLCASYARASLAAPASATPHQRAPAAAVPGQK
eukprot:270285-Pelagomonas_calceolata.AAC.4